MNFKKLVKSIQTAGFNGARTVYSSAQCWSCILSLLHSVLTCFSKAPTAAKRVNKRNFLKIINPQTIFTLVLSAEAVCCLCCAPSWPATRRWRQPRQKGCLLHTMYYYNHRARGRRRTVSEFHYFLGYKGVKVRSYSVRF